MAQTTEYRLETLETVLAEFIMQTNRSLNRMERATEDFKVEMRRERLAHRQETTQQIRAMNQKWGEVTEKLGTFAEDLAAPNLKRIARESLAA